jgi:hypothetical protein
MPTIGGIHWYERFLILDRGVPTLVVQRWQHSSMDNSKRMVSEQREPATPGCEYDEVRQAPGDVPPDSLNDWFDVLKREDFERSFKEDPRCKGKGMSPSRGKYIAYFKKLNARDND